MVVITTNAGESVRRIVPDVPTDKRLTVHNDPIPVDQARRLPRFRGRVTS